MSADPNDLNLEEQWKGLELPKEHQLIVRILNYKEHFITVIKPKGKIYEVYVPRRFREGQNYIKERFAVIERIVKGNKWKMKLVLLLDKITIKYYKHNNVWPPELMNDSDSESSDDSCGLFD